MSDINEIALNDQEEQDDIFYRKYPYYWSVTAYHLHDKEDYLHWMEWADLLSELLENVRCAHKDQLRVRIERFKRTSNN